MSYREELGRSPAHVIALVGDSYTWGLEVSHEQSWGQRLEERLGPAFRVLNFGVDGYGLDQSVLRYETEVRPWSPELVILGFIEHDLVRTMTVFPFLAFPSWRFPFPKPRMAMTPEGLRAVNLPLPAPEELFAAGSIAELAHLEYEGAYDPQEWRWSLVHHSVLLRFLTSAFPRARRPVPLASVRERVRVNAALLRRFRDEVRRAGSIPLVVHFPSRGAGDFATGPRAGERATDAGRVIADAGVDVIDLTACVAAVPAATRFAPRGHYSPAANETVARCLLPAVERALAGGG